MTIIGILGILAYFLSLVAVVIKKEESKITKTSMKRNYALDDTQLLLNRNNFDIGWQLLHMGSIPEDESIH